MTSAQVIKTVIQLVDVCHVSTLYAAIVFEP